MKITAALVSLVMLVLLSPIRAMAGTSVEVARITSMLSAYESMPPRDEWLALGDAAVPILIDISGNAEETSFRRARALTALGYFSDPRALETLSKWAADTTAPGAFRRAALLALADREMSRAMPILRSVLAARDPLMRQVAVKALAQSAEPKARRMLQEQRNRESEAFLVQAIERALSEPVQ